MKPSRAYSRHGLNALKARVKVRGLQAIDRRTAAARALLSWRRDLLQDLGGEEAVSAQQRSLAELVARTKLYVDTLDAWILEQPSLVNARKRALLPVVVQRQQLADSMARMLSLLGLERRAKPVPKLEEYIAGRYGRDGAPDAPIAAALAAGPPLAAPAPPGAVGTAAGASGSPPSSRSSRRRASKVRRGP